MADDKNQPDIATLQGNNRWRAAYQYFVGKGWSPAQAAGIVGGLRGETSGLNPAQTHDNGQGLGIAGWNGDRLTGLMQFTGTQDKNPTDLQTQLDYVDHELRTSESGAGNLLSASTTPQQAGQATLAYFRPSNWNLPGAHPERAQYAGQFYNDFTAPQTAQGAINKAIGTQDASSAPNRALSFAGANDGGTDWAAKLMATPQANAAPQQGETDWASKLSAGQQAQVAPQAAPAQPQTRPDIATPSSNGSVIPIPREAMTPDQQAAQDAAIARGQAGEGNSYSPSEIASQYHPLSAIGQNFQSGQTMAAKGVSDIFHGMPATGVGEVGLGTLGAVASPVTGPLNEATRFTGNLIGNPEAAERASLLVPGLKIGEAAKAVSPSVRALNEIIQTVPENRRAFVASELERNPTLTLMDVNRPSLSTAKGLIVDPNSPNAQNFIQDFVANRGNATNQSIRDAAETLGKIPQPLQVLQNIQQKAANIGKTAIEPVVQNAKPANITSVINNIDKQIAASGGRTPTPFQAKLADLRDQIRGSWADRDPMFADVGGENGLHSIQSNLRSEASDLMQSAVGSERTMGKKLMDVRNQIVNSIDSATNGTYKPALSQYRDAKQVGDSFFHGMGFEQNRSGEFGVTEDSPEAWTQHVRDLTPEQLQAERLGALTAINRKIEGVRSGVQATNIPLAPNTQAKLSTLFGDARAKEFFNAMEDERTKANTLRALSGGSDTAEKILGNSVLPLRRPGAPVPSAAGAGIGTGAAVLGPLLDVAHPALTGGYGSAVGGGLAALLAAGKIGTHIYQRARYANDLATRAQAARLLTTPGAQLSDLINVMRSRSGGQGNKVSNLLSSPIVQSLPR